MKFRLCKALYILFQFRQVLPLLLFCFLFPLFNLFSEVFGGSKNYSKIKSNHMLTDHVAPSSEGTVTGGAAGMSDIKMDMIKVCALYGAGINILTNLFPVFYLFSS